MHTTSGSPAKAGKGKPKGKGKGEKGKGKSDKGKDRVLGYFVYLDVKDIPAHKRQRTEHQVSFRPRFARFRPSIPLFCRVAQNLHGQDNARTFEYARDSSHFLSQRSSKKLRTSNARAAA
jgi:hypothetical protein